MAVGHTLQRTVVSKAWQHASQVYNTLEETLVRISENKITEDTMIDDREFVVVELY